ncbi:MAG: 16S rRNA (cytosine(1402)-N(4))-methyltransferase RsmH, partial [Oscillospiraceae bacterium]
YTREELAKILKEYGEEPYAWYIAGKIVAMREINPLTTTDELVRAIVSALPASVRRKDKNPARRSFQALRIAVNGEMDALSEGLDDLFSMLKPGGRLAIITFHSLEDRIVKQRFKAWATACTCPPEFPVCVCGGKAKAKLITKKPIEADTLEQEDNRRARSAKLRVAEKL